MAVFLAFFLVLLTMVGYSNAVYCICKDGTTDQLQKNIDYACGNGADCNPILQSGSCYNPNTVKDHCSYAVNSYYQRKSSTGATCDFSGTAQISQTAPNAGSGCSYPSSAGGAGTGTGTGTGTPNNPINAPPGSNINNPITTPTGGTTPGFGGLGPSGSGGIDNTGAGGGLMYQGSGILSSLAVMTLVLGLNWFKV